MNRKPKGWLSPKRREFVRLICTGQSYTTAAAEVGYGRKPSTSYQAANILMRDPVVQAEIEAHCLIKREFYQRQAIEELIEYVKVSHQHVKNMEALWSKGHCEYISGAISEWGKAVERMLKVTGLLLPNVVHHTTDKRQVTNVENITITREIVAPTVLPEIATTPGREESPEPSNLELNATSVL